MTRSSHVTGLPTPGAQGWGTRADRQATLIPEAYYDLAAINLRPGFLIHPLAMGAVGVVLPEVLFGLWVVAYILSYQGITLVQFIRRRRAVAGSACRPGNPNLVCRGSPRDLSAVEALDDHFREPVIVDATPFWRSKPAIGIVLLVSAFGFVVLLVVPGMTRPFAVLCAGVFLLLSTTAVETAFPSHYRVTPGLLEHITYSPFRRSPFRYRKASLRNAAVVCSYLYMSVTVIPLDEPDAAVVFNLAGVRRPRQFVRRVFEAYLCSGDAPPLPQDQLIG